MNTLSSEEKKYLETVKFFALDRIADVAEEVDAKGVFPAETLKELAELGVFGLLIPREFGGIFSTHALYYQVIRELAKVCATHTMTLLAHSMCCYTISIFGNENQKSRFLSHLATGENLGCVCMTEESSGSDLGAIKTYAAQEGEEFIMNGSKHFITNGGVAHIMIVLAAVSERKGPFNKSLFLLEKEMRGVRSGRQENKMGCRGSDTRELFFENVRVPDENLLGKKGQGMIQIMKTLESSRLATAAMALGMAEKGFQLALDYSKKRRQFGKAIGQLGIIQQYLADMAMGIECGRLLLEQAIALNEQGKKIIKEAAMAKCYNTDMACEVLSKAMQIHGGRGYMQETMIERLLRDARLGSIIEGTNEIQRRTIAKYLVTIQHHAENYV